MMQLLLTETFEKVELMEESDLNAALPSFVNGCRQFTADEAYQSRCVTKHRWVVEVVDAQIKQFKFLSSTI